MSPSGAYTAPLLRKRGEILRLVWYCSNWAVVSPLLVTRYLHDVYEMKEQRAGYVCLSVRIIQLENC
jgi:hypothetical protein